MKSLHRSVTRATSAAVLTMLCALLVMSCGNKHKRPDGDLVSDKDPVRGFLATIPADTPYAFVAVEPIPLGPMLTWMDGWTKSMQSFMPNFDELLADEYVTPETKLIYAVLDELSGNYTPEGLKKLGFSMSPRLAIYGIGFLPAMRMDLEDPDAFRAFVTRVETRSGFKSQMSTLGKTDFWSYPSDGDYIVMSIVNRQLVWGFTESASAELFTSYLLGEKLPEKSMADDDRISPLAEQYGFQRYGVGFIDFARIAQIVLEPGTSLNDQVYALLEPDGMQQPASPECLAETKRLLAAAPRAVFGYEEWSSSRARFGGGIELHNTLGKQLAETKTSSPLVDSELARQAPFTASFGFDVGRAMDIVNAELLAIRDHPYQCPWYEEFNQLAGEGTMMSAMVPALVTNLRGGAAIVKNVRPVTPSAAPATPPDGSIDPNQGYGSSAGPSFEVEGIAAVTSIDPTGLLAFLRTLAPEFETVTPDPGGIPLALPPSEYLEAFVMPHIILTKSALALTSGDGLADEGSRILATAPSTDAPFMSITYDLKQVWGMLAESGAPPNPLMDSFFFGRTSVELEPRETGIFMHFDMAIPPTTPH